MSKKPYLVTANGELNLNDARVVEHLKEIAVTGAEPSMGLQKVETNTPEQISEAEAQEKAIQELEAMQEKLTVSLSKEQVALLQRESKTLRITAEEHLNKLVQEIFEKRVGRSIVNAASFHSQRVTRPKGTVRTTNSNELKAKEGNQE